MSGIAKAEMEEWDGNAKLSRSQSAFAAGGGGIDLGLDNSPVSLRDGHGDGEREQRRWQPLGHGLRLRHWWHGTVRKDG